MNDLAIFENPEFGRIRGLKIEGEPWFVGKDVAAALGYSDTAQAIRKHIDDEDKGVVESTPPRRKAEYHHHQRKRPVQPDAEKQAARRQEV